MLTLRPFRSGDADTVASWIGDEYAFRQWCADRYDRYPVTGDDIRAKYALSAGTGRFFPVTACDGRGIAGHMILRYTDEEKTSVRFGFVIVDPARRGQGYGRAMLRLALREAFGPLKAKTVTLGVFENNPAAYRCYLAAGFRDCPAEEPEVYHVLGEAWNCLEMAMTAGEYARRYETGPGDAPAGGEEKKMNALVINCSPVRTGATAEIVRLVSQRLEAGYEVRSVCIDDYRFGFCRGCRACHTTAECVQKDDAALLMAELDRADRIVAVSPSYWADVPGQFKAFIDRCTPWCNTHEPHARIAAGKKGYAIALRTGPGMKECDRILDTIEHFYGHLEIACRGRLGLCGVEYREAVAAREGEIAAFCGRILADKEGS